MRTGKTAQINLRVAETVVAELDALADYEHVSRVDVARQILLDGIAQRRRQVALRLYQEGRVTKSKAAELAGISLWEFLDLAASIEPGLSYSVDEAVAEVGRLVAEVAPAYGRDTSSPPERAQR